MYQNGTNDVRLKARTPRTGASAMDHVMIVVALTLGASVPSTNPPSNPMAQRHFADQLSCEQAAALATPPPGTKMICVPAGSGTLIHTAH